LRRRNEHHAAPLRPLGAVETHRLAIGVPVILHGPPMQAWPCRTPENDRAAAVKAKQDRYNERHRERRNAKKREAREFDRFMQRISEGDDGQSALQ